MRKRTQARECALQLLYQYELNPEKLEEVFYGFWRGHDLSAEGRSFTEQIVRGVMKELGTIDPMLTKYAENWDVCRMAIIDRNILRLATYELLFCPDIPPKVTINEAVNIAKKFSQEDSGKFVNGILDRIVHSEASILNDKSVDEKI